MAQDSWPSPEHNGRAVNDIEYEKMAGRFSDDGIYGTPLDTQLVSAGTGLSVTVRSGVYGSLRGHAWYSGASPDTLDIDANVSGSTRIDRVVLRLTRSDWNVTAVVKKGTPGAGVPSLSQSTGDTGTYEIALAEVTLLSGASSVTVVRKELYVGTRTRPCTSNTRNPVPIAGEINYEMDTGRSVVWTGSSWRSVTDYSGVIVINTPTSAWTIGVDSVLEAKNGSVHVRLGAITRAGGTLATDIESRLPVTIPEAYRHPTRDQYGLLYITGSKLGRFQIYSRANTDRAGQVWLTNKPIISNGDNLLAQSGISWVVD